MPRGSGIEVRHGTGCRSRDGGRCNCRPTYRAWVYSAGDGKKLRHSFKTERDARAWRSEANTAIRRGILREPSRATIREAGEALIEGMRSGTVRTRSGDRYKPSAIRGYEAALTKRIYPTLGGARIGDVARRDVQRLADEILAEGRDPSTVRNALMPLRVLYRRAIEDGDVLVNPTERLRLAAVRGKRDRIATPAEAAELIAALPARDRALWAMAFYAGLRSGELQALRWDDVDLGGQVIHVRASWDKKEGRVEPKSASGIRDVPIVTCLGDYLMTRRAFADSRYVFGDDGRPFAYTSVRKRSLAAWKRASLPPIGLHEARHTFASILIDAGVNVKAISSYMGHSSITITLDRYGHLLPGNEAEAVAKVDSYLIRAARQPNVCASPQRERSVD